jgi:hypothetical protein
MQPVYCSAAAQLDWRYHCCNHTIIHIDHTKLIDYHSCDVQPALTEHVTPLRMQQQPFTALHCAYHNALMPYHVATLVPGPAVLQFLTAL